MEVQKELKEIYDAAEWKPLEEMLYHLGVNWGYIGFGLALESGILMEQDESLRTCMKSIYIDVARRNQMNQENVRRDITTLIHVIWRDGNQELLKKLVGRNLRRPPTCQKFIWSLADYLRSEKMKKK